MMYFVIAKYTSKYGVILYCAKCSGSKETFMLDMENCYINTLYFKGSSEIKINEFYTFQTVKGENGLTYAFC